MSRRPAQIARIIASTVIIAATGYAVHRWAYLPYQCNAYKRSAERSVLFTQSLEPPDRRVFAARRNLDESLLWIDRCPRDLDLYMIAAASLRQLERSEDAAVMYGKALTLDRRPEIYLNLGQSQAEANQIAQAIPNLVTAVIFDPALINEVPVLLQDQVKRMAVRR
jgi:tetratricopeptide (TPR) repeat protein